MVDGPITREMTQVGRIGENLAKLAEEKSNISAGDFKSIPSLELDYGDATGNEAQKAVHAICQSLSLSEIKKSAGKWTPDNPIGPGNCPGIKGKFKVKIVFEEAGELILLVPHKHNIEYGLQKPPMEEFPYIFNLPGIKDFATRLLEQHSGEIQKIPGINGTVLAKAVHDRSKEFIRDHPDLQPMDADEKKDVFLDQLGSYSCRQCG